MVTLKHQLEFETIFLIAAAVIASLFFVAYKNNPKLQFNIISSIPSMQIPTEVVAPKITISSQVSPDGTKKVIMKKTQNSDNTVTYDFSTANGNGADEQYIFSKTLELSGSMTIPFNAWSPDNKYFFIEENVGDSRSVFAFAATGVPFSDTEKYFDVTELFKKRNTGNNFAEATGWASETLIIVNTKKPDNTKGPSYWFEIPSKAIIQLSTDF